MGDLWDDILKVYLEIVGVSARTRFVYDTAVYALPNLRLKAVKFHFPCNSSLAVGNIVLCVHVFNIHNAL